MGGIQIDRLEDRQTEIPEKRERETDRQANRKSEREKERNR